MQAPAVVRELRRGERNRKEERDLNEIRLLVGKRHHARVGHVIQQDRERGSRNAAAVAESDASEDDRQIVEVLDRRERGGAVQGKNQGECANHDAPRQRLRHRSNQDDVGIDAGPMTRQLHRKPASSNGAT
jgi:hypothetical protein